MANLGVVFSRKSDEWETPLDFYETLNKEFDFNLDPCATHENHKTEMYFTLEDDGLSKNWGGYNVFCNPPYSEIKKWVQKADQECRKQNTLIVLLVPARTDTIWFHDYIYKKHEVRFIKGRLRFGNSTQNAPFPSMIVIFKSEV